MDNLHDTMKNLQKVAEALSKLNVVGQQPWKSISNMQGMFDGNFWENMVQLTKHDDEKNNTVLDEDIANDVFEPNTDIFQTENKIIVSCEVPGLDQNTLEISVSNNRLLMIKGKIIRKYQYVRSVKKERFYGNFARQIYLPHPVSARGMKRSYVDGILELQLVKRRLKSG